MKKNFVPIKFIVLWFFLVVSFVLLASLILLEANGYRINRQTWRLEKTALIILDGTPDQVELSYNGKTANVNLPVRISKLVPGQYDLVLNVNGRGEWSKNLQLAGGEAKKIQNIILFIDQPQATPLGSEQSVLDNITQSYKNQSSNLVIKNNEIWYLDRLVTRFGDPILGAVLARDKNHIIYQMDQEIRVMELDGSNNNLLAQLQQNTPTVFALSGNKLEFIDNNIASEATIW